MNFLFFLWKWKVHPYNAMQTLSSVCPSWFWKSQIYCHDQEWRDHTPVSEWAVRVTGVMTCHALSRKAREGGQWSVAGSTRPEVETETQPQQTTTGHLGSCSCDHCQCTVGQYRCWHGHGQYGHKMKLIHMMFTYRTALLTMGWYTDQAQVIF